MRLEMRRLRQEQGLTQDVLARSVGLHRAAYTRIEQGHRTPNVLMGLRLARALGSTVEALFGEELDGKSVEDENV